MKNILTDGIILSRTDYGEADRILTVLTPDHGKLRLKARGVRKVRSKLAGGIELFSTSHITYIEGKGELGTLISTRLIKHYGRIVEDITRVQLGYDLIKLLNRATEDHPERAYFDLLDLAFQALDNPTINTELIRLWFHARLVTLAGHKPNLRTDTDGNPLSAAHTYTFDNETMAFIAAAGGSFSANHIKFLRLCFSDNAPAVLARLQNSKALIGECWPLVRTISQNYIKN